MEHSFVDRIDKVCARLKLLHSECTLLLGYIVIILEEHSVGKLHVIAARSRAIVHSAMFEGRSDSAPVEKEDEEVDEDSNKGNGDDGYGDYRDCQGVDCCVI